MGSAQEPDTEPPTCTEKDSKDGLGQVEEGMIDGNDQRGKRAWSGAGSGARLVKIEILRVRKSRATWGKQNRNDMQSCTLV